MEMSRVLRKKASEYIETFEPSSTIESMMVKKQWRVNIEETITQLSYEQRSAFHQCVLDGLQVLHEKVISNAPIHEAALDLIELQILLTQKLLKNGNHQSDSVGALPKYTVKKEISLEDKLQIARGHLEFLGGVNPQGAPIMSQNEYLRLVEYTDHLIQHGEVPLRVEKIKPANISKLYITHTYYLIHKELYGSKPLREVFIHFLRSVFRDFESKPEFNTIRTKFSKAPNSYESDVKKSKSKIGKVS